MLQAIVLGLVQGLTEFLPISSSGHLVVVPAVMGWDKPSLTFDILLHMGTLAAVVLYFRRELIALAVGVLGGGDDPVRARRLAGYLLIGTVPAGVLGLTLGGVFEDLFQTPLYAAGGLVVTAGILLGTERLGQRAKRREVDGRVAVTVGLAQAVALSPGISRSGATIGAGLWLGLSREEATRFSFLLAIPAIAGAGLVSVGDVAAGELEVTASVVAGVVAAFVAGYASIGGLLRLVRTRSLDVFAAYLLVVAPLAAVVILLRS